MDNFWMLQFKEDSVIGRNMKILCHIVLCHPVSIDTVAPG